MSWVLPSGAVNSDVCSAESEVLIRGNPRIPKNEASQEPKKMECTTEHMLGRRGLYSISICAPPGRNRVRVTLGRVLGIPCGGAEIIFVISVREDATLRGANHSHRFVPIY